jgi:UDP-N-acetylmuramoylalanine--D-glutamate ligase
MIPEGWLAGEVAVVGLGRSGAAASRWLVRRGVRVYASDGAVTESLQRTASSLPPGCEVDLGRHDLERIARAAAAVVSPGVPPEAAPVAAARAAGVEVLSEIDLGARALEGTRLVVVTGTNGKTTTTHLVAHLLATAGIHCAAAGNIGRPLTDLADDPARPEWIALEISSFQLHDSPHLVPDVGVLTNLAPDHLDRYPDVATYYADKALLFRNASARSTWVLNGDDAGALGLAAGVPGRGRLFRLGAAADAWLDRERAELLVGDTPLLARASLPLLGDHNVANALAAVLAAMAAGAKAPDLADGLRTFSAPAHRMEPIRTVRDVLWINDSKGTNVAATVVAIAAMDRPYVLIAGGHPKGESFASLAPRLAPYCRRVIAYGEAGPALVEALRGTAPTDLVPGFDAAVARAAETAPAGGAVLLSPACASYDQFNNFEERGERFRRLVEGL